MSNDNSVTKNNEGMKYIIPTAYNNAGFSPITSIFRLTMDQVRKEILSVAKGFINEFTDCTIEVNHRNGMLFAYLWLPNNSKHLRDESTMGGNSVIKKPIFRYSPEFKEFMGKFCHQRNQRTFNAENGLGKVAIEVEIIKFMHIIFDRDGYQYAKAYNTKPVRTDLSLTASFHKSNNKGYGDFKFLQIEKRVKSEVASMELRPKKSYSL